MSPIAETCLSAVAEPTVRSTSEAVRLIRESTGWRSSLGTTVNQRQLSSTPCSGSRPIAD